jgi:hypothetical protein
MTAATYSATAGRLLDRTIDRAAAAELRTHRQFAEDELVIPEGKYCGERWRPDVQPWTGLWLDALDSGRWPRAALTGCVQGGKSLFGQAEPTLKHLFDGAGETVIFAANTEDEAKAKFRKEVLPVILASPRLRRQYPDAGAGSRGGIPTQLHFKNGAVLIFMSGSGGDSTRSSETARVLLVTEADKMDRARETSRETAPVRQLEGRTFSWDEVERQIYLECTVSIPDGVIWQEYENGTRSRIVCQCKACREWCTPEREQLRGWQEAETKHEARLEAEWVCPGCGVIWDDDDRVRMNRRAKLLHRGQKIDKRGRISGEPEPTDTLSFRFNAFNNLFWSTATIAAAEWDAARDVDEDSAERRMRQFYWAIPYAPPEIDLVPLDARTLKRRTITRYPRGLLPDATKFLSVGVDLGKWSGWFVVVAWYADEAGLFRGHIPDYGAIEIPSGSMGVELAIRSALAEFRERVEGGGWIQADGTRRIPDQVWIDARYQREHKGAPAVVCEFARDAGARWRPAMGVGFGQGGQEHYNRPKKTGAIVKLVGDGYHVEWVPKDQVHVAMVDANRWKSFGHERLGVPFDPLDPTAVPVGAVTLFASSDRNEHLTFTKHITAERAQQETVPGVGLVTKWVREGRRANHYLDAYYLSCAAGHLCGVRIGTRPPAPAPPRRPLSTPASSAGLGPGWRPRGFGG